jgi:hypothetical protein
VTLPAAHGRRNAASDRAFVRIGSQGQPLVAVHTGAGTGIVAIDANSGAVVAHWLVSDGAAPVGLYAQVERLSLVTARQVFELAAQGPPRAVTGTPAEAPIVAAVPVGRELALVTVAVGDEAGAEAGILFAGTQAGESSPVTHTLLDAGTTLAYNVSYARGGDLELLTPVAAHSARWQRLGFDAGGNLSISQMFDLPPRDSRIIALDAQPARDGDVLLASVRNNDLWIGRLDVQGAVAPVALAGLGERADWLFPLDVRLRATRHPGEYRLLATLVVANPATRRHDYGLFVAKLVLDD